MLVCDAGVRALFLQLEPRVAPSKPPVSGWQREGGWGHAQQAKQTRRDEVAEREHQQELQPAAERGELRNLTEPCYFSWRMKMMLL